jgi:hypothetical protein
MPITNDAIQSHSFLADMYADEYFPPVLVDKVKAILLGVCEKIEAKKPSLEDLYEITHAATEEINELQEEFEDQDSEIETVARDTIGGDFAFIAEAYGYEADTEELIFPRDW